MIEGKELEAFKEIAKLGSTSVDAARDLCGFIARVLGTVPEDVVGLLLGDWLRQVRIRNAAKHMQRTKEILRERGILESAEPVSPTIALPILKAAQAESKEELQELWARLLANAMDPERSKAVRQTVIDAVKQFDPLDALVLEEISTLPPSKPKEFGSVQDSFLRGRGFSREEIEVSFMNIEKLGCINRERASPTAGRQETALVAYSYFGLEIMRAIEL